MNSGKNAWVELDLSAFEFNINQIKKHTNNCDIIAVVKANAYGHGVLDLIPTLVKNNINKLAVATLEEAIEIREKFINVNILIFGFTPIELSNNLWLYNLEQSVFSYDQAKELSLLAEKNKKVINIHIKLDTGMGRLGFLSDDESIKQISEIYSMPFLNVIGIFSHFATSDAEDKTYAYQQLDNYFYIINKLKEIGIENVGIKHISNSGAILEMKEAQLNCIRPGKILYGFLPSCDIHNKLLLKPILSLKCKIINLKNLDEGCYVGYNNSFITKQKSKIAVLPIGYSDGYSRKLSHKIKVLVNNTTLVPVIATICMNLCMIDVTDIEIINVGDVVILYGDVENVKEISIQHVSKILETSSYEVLCSINPRLPRICI